MILFRLDASIQGERSVSRQVADTAEAAWRRATPAGQVIHRDLAKTPVPADAWALAVAANGTPEEQRTDAQRRALALAAELADEMAQADAYLLAVPLYNYGVSQHVKIWLDLLYTDPRFAPGTEPLLAGRPTALVVTRGGGYGEGTPRAGWDHATPWYRRMFGDLMRMDLHVSEVELTLAEVHESMAPLRPLAKESLRAGHESAERHGRIIAGRTASVLT
ncbi:FMN-dependent NADH-azoreductase [Sphaerisporangium siamense]|uniref:FMN dependent NADH:quinone oxidoreductase n=1 Tax=Sphaerisporangium siamense TaxID=795645 RepID=A0A7W7G7T9_9ACTN|nr:NAD(P)H-dependent oxidoreductase [Sphaerisporangium siamense]MBB4698845.1 FMN-dependent NADH-azoreductase [Sphaerisporangium siamense]GII89031.1 FMN-dependent NADH-azoreductase [Sphaerisporangium siamense]